MLGRGSLGGLGGGEGCGRKEVVGGDGVWGLEGEYCEPFWQARIGVTWTLEMKLAEGSPRSFACRGKKFKILDPWDCCGNIHNPDRNFILGNDYVHLLLIGGMLHFGTSNFQVISTYQIFRFS